MSLSAGERHKGPLLAAFLVLFVFMVVEVIGGFVTGSLALLSDAGHMLTDVIGIGMALAAIHLASRGSARSHRTFGWYRLEILAALANSVLLLGVAVYVLIEAINRFGDPADVLGGPMLVIAILGLLANLVAFWLLREGSKESLNVEGAYLEVLADTVGSVGVIVGAIVLQYTGWEWVDPVVGIAIAVWIVPRTIRLAGQALRILVQAAPPGTDIDKLRADLAAVDGVVDVHDLHVWTLTSDMDVASAHLMVGNECRPAPRARSGARPVARALRHRPRHVASGTGGPHRLRRGRLVSARVIGPLARGTTFPPMTHLSGVWFKVTDLQVASGRGCRVTTVDGEEYLDFAAGIAVNSTGHCHPKVVAAIAEQAARGIHLQANVYTHDLLEPLASRLSELAPGRSTRSSSPTRAPRSPRRPSSSPSKRPGGPTSSCSPDRSTAGPT